MSENTSKLNNDFVRNEIDYKIILSKLWAGKKTIVIITIAGAVLGLLIALLSPKEFKVVTTMLPQSESESGLGKFSSLAAIAGFDLNLGQSGTEISPVIYPQIVESAPFLEELMSTPFKFAKVEKPVSLFDYYLKIKKPNVFESIINYTIGLPYTLKTLFRKETISKNLNEDKKMYMYTKDQSDLMLMMKNRVVLTINKKEGYLTLTTIMPEAMLTAQVAEKSQEILQKTITQYKIEGATEQLKYVEQRYKEKKAEFEKAQQKLAYYNDRNQNINTSMAKTELDRLQSEYDIANSVYSELAKLLEQSKLQVKKRTPVFTIIKPVVVPNEKFKPKRMTILAIWTILGLIGGAGYIFVKEYISYTKGDNKVSK
jgi:capsular polysaccharide biosynthesis protein